MGTINGTSGDDTLVGTNLGESINGLAGNDSLSGLGGNDILYGGPGDDALDGGDGIDTASYATATGAVTVNLTTGTSSGAAGNDTLTSIENVTGSAYDDTLIGDWHDNKLSGGGGNDYFETGAVASGHTYDGGDGIDTVSYADWYGGSISLGGYAGLNSGTLISIENVIGSEQRDFIDGSAGDNVIEAGGGDDRIYTNGGSDQVYGQAGDDELVFSSDPSIPAANVLFDGGDGSDTILLYNTITGIAVDLSLKGVAQDLGPLGTITLANVEGVVGTPFDDTITGNDSDNRIVADDGNDVLNGGGGNDWFEVGLGNKIIDGGAGSDTLRVGSSIPTGGDVGQTISLALSGRAQTVIPGVTVTLTNVENLTGWYGNDNFTGNSGNNILDGYYGNDVLWGGAGDDALIGGVGTDTARYSKAISAVQVDLLAGTAHGGDGNDTLSTIENVIGSAFNDTLLGDDGANQLDGGAGADYMRGRGGDDTYIVNDTGDQVIEGSNGGIDTVMSSVTFTLTGYAENLTLTGSAAINATGNNLANVLTGNAGANVLAGSYGNDTYIIQNVDDQVVEASASGGVDTVQSAISYALGAYVENLTLTGSARTATGNELNNVLTGNDGSNVLDGGLGADTLQGGLGNDTYVVDSLRDRIVEPGDPYDYYNYVYGGTDTVRSSVSWTLDAQFENLTLTGTAAINGTGNDWNNVIIGNAAANVIDGGFGSDKMSGGGGDDVYIVDNPFDTVIEGSTGGIDTVRSSSSFALGSYVENLILTGQAVNGTGNSSANTILGNSADNVIDGGQGADSMRGGAGNDTYYVDNAGDAVIELAGGGYDEVKSSASFTLRSNIEALTLTGSASINGIGNDLNNSIVGNSGNNILDGRAGADRMDGGAGNDTYIVDNANDVIFDVEGGIDTVNSSISFSLVGLLYADIENLTLTGTANINATGDQHANLIIGNSGDNIINGDTGGDTLKGGAGNDTYIVYGANDQVVEGLNAGTDTVHAYVSYSLSANVETLVLDGWDAANGTGNDLDNTIVGSAADNVLDGKGGADTLEGEGGNDTFIIDNVGDRILHADPAGDNTVISSITYALGDNLDNLVLSGTGAINGNGNALDNVLFGNDAANVLTGADGSDYLEGFAGNDTLSGGTGDDILIGGAGSDTLQGGAGSDAFGFDYPVGPSNVDTITDFSTTDDLILLSSDIFAALSPGDLSASAFQAGTSASDATDRIIYDKATGSIYYDSDGTGTSTKTLFAKVAAGTNLTAANFYVVDTASAATAMHASASASSIGPGSDTLTATAATSPGAAPHGGLDWALLADRAEGLDLHHPTHWLPANLEWTMI